MLLIGARLKAQRLPCLAETVVGNELCKNIAGIQAVVNVKYEYTAESHTISVRVQLSFHEESCKLWINIQTF